MKYARLGVNIDHVATLRQQRGEVYPEVDRAAQYSLKAGAHQITIHLREDRRHIQDSDVPKVFEVCKKLKRPLNLEVGCAPEMVKIAIKTSPDWICLVPEKRQERTTEGGLDILGQENFQRIKQTCQEIKARSPQTKISLFVESAPLVLEKCLSLNADAVEIHTGEYARDYLAKKDYSKHLHAYQEGSKIIKKAHWGYHAGHGLTLESILPLLELGVFEEYNVGHWIVGESVFSGIGPVVEEMLQLINQFPLKV